MNFTGIVLKTNTAPRGHALVFSPKAAQEIVDKQKFINKPLFASPTLMAHTNAAKKTHIGYITDCWLDREGYLHIFGEFCRNLELTNEPLGLSMDSIIHDLCPTDFAIAKWVNKLLRVESLYVQGATLLLHECAAFQCSNFFLLG
jgi:hypothetical protein